MKYQTLSGEELNLEGISKPEEETLQIMLDDWQKHPYSSGTEFTQYWTSFVEQACRRGARQITPLSKISEDLGERLTEKSPYGELKFLLYQKAEISRATSW